MCWATKHILMRSSCLAQEHWYKKQYQIYCSEINSELFDAGCIILQYTTLILYCIIFIRFGTHVYKATLVFTSAWSATTISSTYFMLLLTSLLSCRERAKDETDDLIYFRGFVESLLPNLTLWLKMPRDMTNWDCWTSCVFSLGQTVHSFTPMQRTMYL